MKTNQFSQNKCHIGVAILMLSLWVLADSTHAASFDCAKFIGTEMQITVGPDEGKLSTYAWDETSGTADGTIIDRVEKVGFNNLRRRRVCVTSIGVTA